MISWYKHQGPFAPVLLRRSLSVSSCRRHELFSTKTNGYGCAAHAVGRGRRDGLRAGGQGEGAGEGGGRERAGGEREQDGGGGDALQARPARGVLLAMPGEVLARTERADVLTLEGPSRSTTPSLLIDLEVSSWGGRKEGSVFDALKREAEDGSRDVATRKSEHSRLGTRSSACATPQAGRYTTRPRFCHNVSCDMFARPFYADAQVRTAACQRCGRILLKHEPSTSWLRVLEPESGPVLHTAAWKTSPALPAPGLGAGYGAGRKVSQSRVVLPRQSRTRPCRDGKRKATASVRCLALQCVTSGGCRGGSLNMRRA